MQITVEYTAQVKRAAGVAGESIDVDSDCSVQDLLKQIANRHGDPLAGLLLGDTGALSPSILLFVNDEQVRWETPRLLHENDVLTILSPISGG